MKHDIKEKFEEIKIQLESFEKIFFKLFKGEFSALKEEIDPNTFKKRTGESTDMTLHEALKAHIILQLSTLFFRNFAHFGRLLGYTPKQFFISVFAVFDAVQQISLSKRVPFLEKLNEEDHEIIKKLSTHVKDALEKTT